MDLVVKVTRPDFSNFSMKISLACTFVVSIATGADARSEEMRKAISKTEFMKFEVDGSSVQAGTVGNQEFSCFILLLSSILGVFHRFGFSVASGAFAWTVSSDFEESSGDPTGPAPMVGPPDPPPKEEKKEEALGMGGLDEKLGFLLVSFFALPEGEVVFLFEFFHSCYPRCFWNVAPFVNGVGLTCCILWPTEHLKQESLPRYMLYDMTTPFFKIHQVKEWRDCLESIFKSSCQTATKHLQKDSMGICLLSS